MRPSHNAGTTSSTGVGVLPDHRRPDLKRGLRTTSASAIEYARM
ncbi:MAG TPA: hypothetical protein VF210_01870 [Pseudomonadales bacterium]